MADWVYIALDHHLGEQVISANTILAPNDIGSPLGSGHCRERLLQAATVMFSEKGFSGTTIRGLA